MKDQEYTIRNVSPDDAPDITRIYNYYIADTIVTFEEKTVSEDVIGDRINDIQLSQLPWFVAEKDGKILGYSYASKWKERCAYRFSVEVTIYMGRDHVGKGIGYRLYNKVFAALESQGIHAAIAVIALPNDASIKLHEKMGFLKVAQLSEVGFKFNRWIDVGYWQRIL